MKKKLHGVIAENPKRVLVFDFDGTLLDSTLREFERIRLVLQAFQLRMVSLDYVRSLWGEPVTDIYRQIGQEVGATEEQISRFMEVEKRIDPKYELHPLLVKVFYLLRGKGYLIALITNRSREPLVEVSEQIGLDLNVFNYIQTPEDYPFRKPDGRVFDPILDLAASHGLRKLTYFGDTLRHDYSSVVGSKASIDFVGVSSGIDTPADFRRAGVENVIDGVDGLPHFLVTNYI